MAEEKKTTQDTQQEVTAMAECFLQDLIPEILLCLPVKSLGRFKSVCKRWNWLISSHHFAKCHTQLSSAKKPASLLFVVDERHANRPLVSMIVHPKDILNLQVDACGDIIGKSTCLPKFTAYYLGSSHALLCVQEHSDSSTQIHIVNHTTKEYKNIPLPSPTYECFHGYGFGFVPSMDHYKLVLLGGRYNPFTRLYTDLPFVFSSRDDSWRELDILNAYETYRGYREAARWNSAFYWVVSDCQGVSLLRFDVVSEEFSWGGI